MDRDEVIERARDWLKQNDKFDYLREASLSTVMADFANSERKAAVDEYREAVFKRLDSRMKDGHPFSWALPKAIDEVYAEMFECK